MTELHPELEKALREWKSGYDDPKTPIIDSPFTHNLATAVIRHLPEPSFGDRVLAHMPEGWKMAQKAWDTGRWSFWKDEKRELGQRPTPSFYILESEDPAAVAKALLLLSGEADND